MRRVLIVSSSSINSPLEYQREIEKKGYKVHFNLSGNEKCTHGVIKKGNKYYERENQN